MSELLNSGSNTESSSNESVDDENMPESSWVEWYCHLKGNEFFVEVDEDYIRDDFNLTGLSQVVPWYDEALSTILDEDRDDDISEDDADMLESAIHILYGMIHARYLLTSRGIQGLYEKFNEGVYGLCWNEKCESERRYTLPIGMDVVGQESAHVYCPYCGETYKPRSSKLAQIDGAYFGSSAAHMLVLQYAGAIKQGSTPTYIPLLSGFRIFPRNQRLKQLI